MNARSKQLLFCCFFLFLIILAVNFVNAQPKKKEIRFRMEKINYVWNKAMAQLFSSPESSPNRLDKLQKDLANFDSLYLSLKQDGHHIKATEKSVDEIDSKLETLLKKYDLEETIYAFRMKYKYDSAKIYSATTQSSQGSSDRHQATFKDARLMKIWDKIKLDESFSLDELDNFYNELREHEQTLDKYNEILKQISSFEQQHNHILKEDHEENLEEQYKQQLLDVKTMNQDLERNLQKMQQRLDQVKENPFKNTKVRRLWDKAVKNRNLIPNELDTVKSELRHFERQLEKIDFHREQLQEVEEFSQGSGKEGPDGHADELHKYQEKMERKIKKLEHYLDEKLSSVHSEL